ncbi:MAG: diguanylate cyclase domain-containing protein [Reyranellales bacterium]
MLRPPTPACACSGRRVTNCPRDAVLRTAAAQLGQALRHQDIPIRWGGDEFLIALPDIAADNAQKMLRRLAAIAIGLRPDGT